MNAWLKKLILAMSMAIGLSTFASADVNQTLEGQLSGLVNDIRELMKNDVVLGAGRKLKLEAPSAEGMDDHLTPFFEQALKLRLGDLVDETSSLRLKLVYSYVESSSLENKGKRVIQMVAKLFDKGKPIKLPTREGSIPVDELAVRDVNNTADIGRLLGVTMTPVDSKDHQQRLNATEDAFENPKFKQIGASQVASPEAANFAVELRRRISGKGEAAPVTIKNANGQAFAAIEIGDTYEIVLYNLDSQRDVVAKINIDGLDAISAFCTDTDSAGKKVVYPGYFIPRATAGKPGEHVVPGWLNTVKRGSDNVFDFVVNELGKGAASSLNVKGKSGVVTVSFFVATKPDEKTRSRNFGETGLGKPRKQDYDLVEAVVESEPASIVSIRYSHSPK